ncbi:MAG: ABC transporter permease, partial [Bacteroidota bacterium]
MFNLEDSIKKWLADFQRQRAFDEGKLQEMEQHLRDHVEDLVQQGASEKEAFEQAVASFGEVPRVAKEEFRTIKRKPSIKTFLFTTMLNNYFKTSLRSMMKTPLSSFINVFGLAVAIGACMVVYAFIDFDLSIDRFHENKDELFLSTHYVNREGVEECYGNAPAPLGAMLKADFSSIKNVARIYDGVAVVKQEENVFHESLRYVDPEFLSMFTFPLKWGVAQSLHGVNNVILSEETAKKYFGEENPVGQQLKIIVSQGIHKVFNVSGVAKPFPKARIIDFSILLHIENLDVLNPTYAANDWAEMLNATFIQVDDPSTLDVIKQKMGRYKQYQNEVESDWPITSFDFVNLADLHLASDEIKNGISYDASDEARIGLPVIALFILALACLNYLNIAIVSAARRLKEIGMRKVIGASKGLIVFQFLSENLFMTALAGGIGFLLAALIFLPWFSTFTDISSDFNLLDPNMWTFLLVILIGTGIVSGMYPAFYIARFQVIKIFRGTVKFGKKNLATKIFLTVQLVLTCVGIGFAVMYAQNSRYQAHRKWGYNEKQLLYAQLQNGEDFDRLSAMMAQHTDVLEMAGSKDHLAKKRATKIVRLSDQEFEVAELNVGANYAATTGLEVTEGRFFKENYESDQTSIVVNELFLKNLDLNDPLNQQVKIDSTSYQIVGVVKDFYFRSFYSPRRPTIFTLADASDFEFITLKIKDGSQVDSYHELQAAWSALFPETPFNGGFQRDAATWLRFYQDLGKQQRFTRAIAIIFIILASLGLYGLIQLNITGRLREFSIRKTLGADVKS